MKKVERTLRDYIHYGKRGNYEIEVLGINPLKDTSIIRFKDGFKIEIPNDALRR